MPTLINSVHGKVDNACQLIFDLLIGAIRFWDAKVVWVQSLVFGDAIKSISCCEQQKHLHFEDHHKCACRCVQVFECAFNQTD